MDKVYLNGNYVSAKDANISIFDRGFLFGDGVYEVIPVYNKKTCFIKEHLSRLGNSLRMSKLSQPNDDLLYICHHLVEINDINSGQIYLQVTRGNDGRRHHDICKDTSPTVIAFILNNPFPSEEKKTKGLSAKIVDDIRWEKCNIKSTSLMANILLNDEAVSGGYDTAILLKDGFITEGSTSNIFILDKSNTIKTTAYGKYCLPGITRSITNKILHKLNIPILEQMISKKELLDAKEIWLTSTTKEISRITNVDDCVIGTKEPSDIWKKVNNEYKNMVNT